MLAKRRPLPPEESSGKSFDEAAIPITRTPDASSGMTGTSLPAPPQSEAIPPLQNRILEAGSPCPLHRFPNPPRQPLNPRSEVIANLLLSLTEDKTRVLQGFPEIRTLQCEKRQTSKPSPPSILMAAKRPMKSNSIVQTKMMRAKTARPEETK